MSMLDLMKKAGIKITRESYINCAWGNPLPDPWGAEEEALLPEHLQDWSLFEMRDGELLLKDGAFPNDQKD